MGPMWGLAVAWRGRGEDGVGPAAGREPHGASLLTEPPAGGVVGQAAAGEAPPWARGLQGAGGPGGDPSCCAWHFLAVRLTQTIDSPLSFMFPG